MKRFCFLSILIVMTISAFSQEMPASDKFNTPAGVLEIRFIGHASLMFTINNQVVYVDPVSSQGSFAGLPKADIILVTHEHGDHLDATQIKNLQKESTVLYCNAKSAESISWAKAMKPGEEVTVNGIGIKAVYAYNIKNMRAPGQPYHPKGNGNGYVVTMGGKKIYIAGDTENIPEMGELKDIYIAFLPMNLPFTMTPDMVADAAKTIKPAILYPYHYGSTKLSDLVSQLQNTGIEVRIRDLK